MATRGRPACRLEGSVFCSKMSEIRNQKKNTENRNQKSTNNNQKTIKSFQKWQPGGAQQCVGKRDVVLLLKRMSVSLNVSQIDLCHFRNFQFLSLCHSNFLAGPGVPCVEPEHEQVLTKWHGDTIQTSKQGGQRKLTQWSVRLFPHTICYSGQHWMPEGQMFSTPIPISIHSHLQCCHHICWP